MAYLQKGLGFGAEPLESMIDFGVRSRLGVYSA